jgi:hypothetical protein
LDVIWSNETDGQELSWLDVLKNLELAYHWRGALITKSECSSDAINCRNAEWLEKVYQASAFLPFIHTVRHSGIRVSLVPLGYE